MESGTKAKNIEKKKKMKKRKRKKEEKRGSDKTGDPTKYSAFKNYLVTVS